MKKCAKIQIFKINHSRIENLGQKWRMRFFMAKNRLLFEIKLPLCTFIIKNILYINFAQPLYKTVYLAHLINSTSLLGKWNYIFHAAIALKEIELENSPANYSFLCFLKPIALLLTIGFFLFSRFVNYYTLATHNFTSQSNNVTFHHSRLMGVSDIENAVSI